MKKSHPIRHRRLAVRRAHRARTLAHRRQVEALAALMGYRRAEGEMNPKSAWPEVVSSLMELFRHGRFGLAGIFGPSITYDEGAIWKRRA